MCSVASLPTLASGHDTGAFSGTMTLGEGVRDLLSVLLGRHSTCRVSQQDV
jgi:hypothetical protein